MLRKNDDYEHVCALCEHFRTIGMTGDTVCKLKKAWRNVRPESTCSHFELDLITIDPRPKKMISVEIDANI